MQQAVDVVEEVFLDDRATLALGGIGGLEMGQPRVADAVAPGEGGRALGFGLGEASLDGDLLCLAIKPKDRTMPISFK
jgi:hypothetical protein